jgi:hypothetical protein
MSFDVPLLAGSDFLGVGSPAEQTRAHVCVSFYFVADVGGAYGSVDVEVPANGP